ncbi:hypothetical protein AMTRI_Chr11g102210 [Amborella trichopoda]
MPPPFIQSKPPTSLSLLLNPLSLSSLKQTHAHLLRYSPHDPTTSWLPHLLSSSAQLPHPTYTFSLYAHLLSFSLCPPRSHPLSVYPFLLPPLLKSASLLFLPILGASLHALALRLGLFAKPNIQNSILNLYSNLLFLGCARQVFDEMHQRTPPDWNSMISAYARVQDLKNAQKLFDSMPERTAVSWTAMLSAYAKCGQLSLARDRFFDKMPNRTVVSWNAMLSGYAQKGFVNEAIELFRDMVMRREVPPNETTLATVVSACSKHGDPELAEWIIGFVDQCGVKPNCFVKTAMVDMYCKCGSLEKARELFDAMTHKNSFSWNAMISGYSRNGNLCSARELFDKMPNRTVVSWNSMIAGYAQNGLWSLAIELFKEMVERARVGPDEVTMVSVISACGHLGALDLANWVRETIGTSKIRLSLKGYNSMIHMYSKCGSMEEACRVFFDEMPERDVVSYNALIAGFAQHGHGTEALELFHVMNERGIEPDSVTYIGVLTACSHAGLVQEGCSLFQSIGEPSVDHYACMVDLLGRVGRLRDAETLIKKMPVNAHAGVYGALLNACRMHRDIEIGEKVAAELFRLEPDNPGNYVLLSNMYAAARRWEDVERVRTMMRAKGIRKTQACSWVEFRGKIHQFIAGDCSHPELKEIYKVLEELMMELRRRGYVPDKSSVLRDVEEEEKEELVGTHSEKLAIAFGLLALEAGVPIRVMKNLRVCGDCHGAIKLMSKVVGREILVRDNNRFHLFKDGHCSCKDYW